MVRVVLGVSVSLIPERSATWKCLTLQAGSALSHMWDRRCPTQCKMSFLPCLLTGGFSGSSLCGAALHSLRVPRR